MKKVLGIDLGVASVGWALVNQGEEGEKSSIIAAGDRIVPFKDNEQKDFEAGKSVTTNSDRRMKRSARRNLQRYKLRRQVLRNLLKEQGWIDDESILHEDGPMSTFETYRLRSKAVTEEISLQELARVLLMLNKKRGYKSSRKINNSDDEGSLIDSMDIAKELYNNDLTPGQYSLKLLMSAKGKNRKLPTFYGSDLKAEFDKIAECQAGHYPDKLTKAFLDSIRGKSKKETEARFRSDLKIYTAENKGKDKKLRSFEWRAAAVSQQLPLDQVAYVLAELNGEISSSSQYLGNISDRSKILHFRQQTVGQYLMSELESNPQFRVRGKVFYRQDYMDEFEKIWENQTKYHTELTPELKHEIRDIIIFYQRRLKSQKSLISFCELESHNEKRTIDGKERQITIGPRVAPKSSPLFQEFKLWSTLNNIRLTTDEEKERKLTPEEKELLASELAFMDKMKPEDAVRLLFGKHSTVKLNYKELEGNLTLASIYAAFADILEEENCGCGKLSSASKRLETMEASFTELGYNPEVLRFNPDLPAEEYDNQALVRLWHLIYSYEGDDSTTGDSSLIKKVAAICNMPESHARTVANIRFVPDYASLSQKAIRKILPNLKQGMTYYDACVAAGYEKSGPKELLDSIPSLAKGELRNPTVEKILNQMINVINNIGSTYGKPDEIHIEMARSLKNSKKEREKMTKDIAQRTRENAEIVEKIRSETGKENPSRNDILKYRLYQELSSIGYKALYSNKEIRLQDLFGSDITIEHIIPQALYFDDSYSNKTLEYADVNIEKGKRTAYDFILDKYGESELEQYRGRVTDLLKSNKISRKKAEYLLMRRQDIPNDFLNRDLSDTRYITRKAKEILEQYAPTLITTGSITACLREQWKIEEEFFSVISKTGGKRTDQRHHVMDAITIAFTRPAHIQILNNLNAGSDRDGAFYGLKTKEMHKNSDSHWVFNPPMPYDELRKAVREMLESTLVSYKSGNKVVTSNVNKTKSRTQHTLTPRGALHKEQVYGKLLRHEDYEMAVGAKLTADEISKVSNPVYRKALRERLEQFGGDPKAAFTGKNALGKKPIYIDELHSASVPEKVKCTRTVVCYKIRKPMDASLTVSKVIDGRIKSLLEKRLEECGGDVKKAFSNLDENPIWFNEEKKIPVKTVTIAENFDLDPIHYKRDRDGKFLTDENGQPVPTDFVNFRNNHHVAIYVDDTGEYQEHVVSLFEAVRRVSEGKPVIDRQYMQEKGWKFLFSLKRNEMFVFPDPASGFEPSGIDLLEPKNRAAISPHLFRVQKLSSKDYWFRHHLDTSTDVSNDTKDVKWKRVTALRNLQGVVKVRLNNLGQIVAVGEE